MDNKNRNIAIIALSIAVIAILQMPFTLNFWMLITQKDFDIPKESSFWSFRADKVNNERDNWWFYGHDGKNYYYKDNNGFKVFAKKDSSSCEGFLKTDFKTWCQ